MCEGRAVQGEGLVLAPLTTHVAAKPVPQPQQVGLQLPDALAQVLVGLKAQGSNLQGGGVYVCGTDSCWVNMLFIQAR